jgi:hypothetical protein
MVKRNSRSAASLFICFDTEAFRHAIQRAAIDPHQFGSAGSIAAHFFQNVDQVTAFEFIQRWEIVVDRR